MASLSLFFVEIFLEDHVKIDDKIKISKKLNYNVDRVLHLPAK